MGDYSKAWGQLQRKPWLGGVNEGLRGAAVKIRDWGAEYRNSRSEMYFGAIL